MEGGVATMRGQRPSLTERGASAPLLNRSSTAETPRRRLGGRQRRSQSVTAAHLATPSMNSKGKVSMPNRRRRSKDMKSNLPSIPSVDEDAEEDMKEVPDMDWTTGSSRHKKDGEGSTGTETTMDSSCDCGSYDGSAGSGGVARAEEEKPDMDWGSHNAAAANTGAVAVNNKRAQGNKVCNKKGSTHGKRSVDLDGSNNKGSSHGKKKAEDSKRRSGGSGRGQRKSASSDEEESKSEQQQQGEELVPKTPSGRMRRGKVPHPSTRANKKAGSRSNSPRLSMKSPKKAIIKPEENKPLGSDWFGELKDMSVADHFGPEEEYSSEEEEDEEQDEEEHFEVGIDEELSQSEEEEESESDSDEEEDPEKLLAAAQEDDNDDEKPKRPRQRRPKQPTQGRRMRRVKSSDDLEGRRRQQHPVRRTASRGDGGGPVRKPHNPRGPKRSQTFDEGRRRRPQGMAPPPMTSRSQRRKPRAKSVVNALLDEAEGERSRRPQRLISPFETEDPIIDEPPPTPRRGGRRASNMIPTQQDLGYDEPPPTPSRRGRRTVPTAQDLGYDEPPPTPSRRGRRTVPTAQDLGYDEPPPTPSRRGRRSPATIPTAQDLGYGANDAAVPQTPRRRGRRASLGSANTVPRPPALDDNSIGAQSEMGVRARMSRRGVGGSVRHLQVHDDDEEELQEDLLSVSLRKSRSQRRLSVAANVVVDEADGSDDDDAEDANENDHTTMSNRTERLRRRGSQRGMAMEPMTPRRRQRSSSVRSLNRLNHDNLDNGETDSHDNAVDASENDHMAMSNRSERLRRRGSQRGLSVEPMTPRRRQQRSASVRSLNRLGYDNLDDEEEDPKKARGGLPTLGAHFASENSVSDGRGRRQTRDDGSVGARSAGSLGCGTARSRNRSSSRSGRYGYNAGQERLCLSAVPSTPKKSVGLAAMLYCKPLDLGGGKDDDDEQDIDIFDVSDTQNPAESDDDDDASVGSDDNPAVADKTKNKKDYWKAKLAGKA